MKKILVSAFALAFAAAAFAAKDSAASADQATTEPAVAESAPVNEALWPAFFAISDWPSTPDIIGMRLTLPYSARQENVTGIDLGLWGRSLYFEGIQINVIRNDVKDMCNGFQIGLYNSAGSGEMFGIQAGLWNESQSLRGIQAGLVNTCGSMQGFQIGLINRSETNYGFQVGLINVIREGEVVFCPVVNVGF